MQSYFGKALSSPEAAAFCRKTQIRHQIAPIMTSRSFSNQKDPPSQNYTKLSSTKSITIPNSQDPRVQISPLGNGITHVLLSRPSKLNSLDLPMFESIASAASTIRNDKDCRVVIMSGEGRAFCTGLDAKSVAFEGRALERLLDRPSGYSGGDGGKEGIGNLAQDVGYLWR
jgi:hypothetical protein